MTVRHRIPTKPVTASRRALLVGLGVTPLLLLGRQTSHAEGDSLVDPKTLKPGEFAWHPERSPDGPVVIIVSVPDQWVAVYRNGIRIAVSTCSTGRPGHDTPTGLFVILQKDVDHHSSLYNDAPMPYMERVTWGGVALHAGDLPGYPASHGCVRLPKAFARLLFGVTHLGTAVIIANRDSVPVDVLHPGLLLSGHAEQLAQEAVEKAKGNPLPPVDATTADHQVVSVVISTLDKRIMVFVNGELAFEDAVTLRQPDLPFGTHVFDLTGPSDNPSKLKWLAVDMDKALDSPQQSALLFAATVDRVNVPDATAKRLSAMLHPGATMVITDRPADVATRTGPGFTIMTSDES